MEIKFDVFPKRFYTTAKVWCFFAELIKIKHSFDYDTITYMRL